MDVRRMEEDVKSHVLRKKIRTRHETQEHIQVYDCLFAPFLSHLSGVQMFPPMIVSRIALYAGFHFALFPVNPIPIPNSC